MVFPPRYGVCFLNVRPVMILKKTPAVPTFMPKKDQLCYCVMPYTKKSPKYAQ